MFFDCCGAKDLFCCALKCVFGLLFIETKKMDFIDPYLCTLERMKRLIILQMKPADPLLNATQQKVAYGIKWKQARQSAHPWVRYLSSFK